MISRWRETKETRIGCSRREGLSRMVTLSHSCWQN